MIKFLKRGIEMNSLHLARLRSFYIALLVLIASPISAQTADTQITECDLELLSSYEAEFDEIIEKKTALGLSVDKKLESDSRTVGRKYIEMNAACFSSLYGQASGVPNENIKIDDDGIRMPSDLRRILNADSANPRFGGIGVGEFFVGGTKWGANSEFFGGQDRQGPGTSGGLVTYSFMPSGVSHQIEDAIFGGSTGSNLSINSLPSFQSCFETEITRAFAAWSAVSDIQFQRVESSGLFSNAPGAGGDIRVGSHFFDGQNGILAHAFFPAPNFFSSLVGDIHFDRQENWSCSPINNGFDIGIVALHEIGHSIGLDHEEAGDLAIMNPFYNPSLSQLLTDDIQGAVSIYGTPQSSGNGGIVLFLEESPVVIPLLRDSEPIPSDFDNPVDGVPSQCRQSVGNNPNTSFNSALVSNCRSATSPDVFVRYIDFQLTSTRTVSIDQSSTSFDTFLLLHDGNGQLVFFDDDSGVGLNSRIQLTLAAGSYTIEASSFSGASLGSFTLQIR